MMCKQVTDPCGSPLGATAKPEEKHTALEVLHQSLLNFIKNTSSFKGLHIVCTQYNRFN
jgi:hypothetical protein